MTLRRHHEWLDGGIRDLRLAARLGGAGLGTVLLAARGAARGNPASALNAN